MKVSFGRFVFDSEARELLDEGRRVRLSPKAFDLLRILLERRPAVVSRGDLQDLIWGPGTVVGDANLSVIVAEVRQALGDDPQSAAFVRTVHRVGYAFSGSPVDLSARGSDSGGVAGCRCWINWAGRTFRLGDGEHVIGRDPRCGIWVDASGVSRRHARIVVAAERARIEDLGSSNGTSVGGHDVTFPRELTDGDAIEAGSATLTFRRWSEDRPPRTERLQGRRRG